ncbi:exo-beta-N-acetylmuramidase NamZ family protein [Ulvibacter litoralis]|uniref:Uncharacterized conserved protein YbbC, DUF1343 family n=1 Tax=Ulvibacter litoralis TaxID=227084 RepID=A0A1G7INW2_9FLAO|nr:DUF1343 domain-containing protein [Ulvibacter litoralis]GHC61464.1 hypothetical protein GCM10008083_28270 [Ulvibacter litoralis]SDF14268.1 Uncharacterized conserved protein YbbC, DUF1343 family [Ulvibacter litoralis]
MKLSFVKNTLILTLLVCFSCGSKSQNQNTKNQSEGLFLKDETIPAMTEASIVLGADRFQEYLPLLANKKVGIVANQTSVVNNTHLVDVLLDLKVSITKVFAPEHGFRGTADAGELIKDGIDTKTGLPIISLYGKNKKPSLQQLQGIDVIIFDIQDVGARFYTYISTLHYVMEACAEANIPVIVFDRPNPNGHYIDGPILEPEHSSFVGMHPIPVVHGMTIGEYAKMINGEGWLQNKVLCDLSVISMENYNHQIPYSLPIKPSPNLPNDTAINLYPSLCFFEGTFVSAGRGTELQFQIFGAPSLDAKLYPFSFTPKANEGSKYPKFKDEKCYGMDLQNVEKLHQINLDWLIDTYASSHEKETFFIPFFTKLAGTEKLQKQIEAGQTSQEIRKSWAADLQAYNQMRQPYLLYK